MVNPALFSPAALKLVSYLPPADDQCGQLTYEQPADSKQGQAVGRMDFQQSANQSIFGRYMATFDKAPAPYAQTGNVLTLAGGGGLDNLAQSLTMGDTLDLWHQSRQLAARGVQPDVDQPRQPGVLRSARPGRRNFHTYRDGEMVLAVTGGFNISAATSTTGIFWTNSYQVTDDVTMVRGRHQLGFGANIAYWKSSQTSHARSGGSFMFNGQTTGRGLADLLVGALGSVEHGVPNLLVMDMDYVGLYAQDAWRMSDRVTLNLGVRWEPFLGQQMLYGGATNFNHDNFVNNVKSQVFLNAPRRPALPRRQRLPRRQERLQEAVARLLAAPRAGVGRARRRPPGVPLVLRADLRLPERRLHEHQCVGAAVGQPVADHHHHVRRSVRDRRRQPASDRDEREHRSSRPSVPSASWIRTSRSRACSPGTSRWNSSCSRTGR